MTTTADLMMLGAFAARTRLTPKALRLYDALGLLAPAWTDPDSGYRYYAEAQVARANLIAVLRQLEMPLDRIARVLELPGPAAAAEVHAYWREVQLRMRERRGLVLYLDAKLNPTTRKGHDMIDIRTREVPERKILSIHGRVYKDGIADFIISAHRRLLDHVAAAPGAARDGAPFMIYFGRIDHDSDGPLEACVPFSGSIEPESDLRVRIDPAHTEAYTVMTKGSTFGPELMQAYDAVFGWLHEHGRKARMDLGGREVYFEEADWEDLADEAEAFEVAIPFEEA